MGVACLGVACVGVPGKALTGWRLTKAIRKAQKEAEASGIAYDDYVAEHYPELIGSAPKPTTAPPPAAGGTTAAAPAGKGTLGGTDWYRVGETRDSARVAWKCDNVDTKACHTTSVEFNFVRIRFKSLGSSGVRLLQSKHCLGRGIFLNLGCTADIKNAAFYCLRQQARSYVRNVSHR